MTEVNLDAEPPTGDEIRIARIRLSTRIAAKSLRDFGRIWRSAIDDELKRMTENRIRNRARLKARDDRIRAIIALIQDGKIS